MSEARPAPLALLVLMLIALLAGCGASTVASTAEPSTASTTSTTAQVAEPAKADAQLSASSAYAADHLGELLTAPRPAPPATLPPDANPPPTEPPPPPYKTGPRAESPIINPPRPLPVGDGTVYAVGDSVLLGAEPYLHTTLGGWDLRLDGKVGRRLPEGIDIIRANQKSLGQAVIVVLGHNDGGGSRIYGQLDELMSLLKGVQRVVMVTVTEWTPGQAQINRAIRVLPRTYPNVVVAEWAGVVAANPGFLRDNVHPNNAGAVALANLIAVMLGPARPDGRSVPPPRILAIPDPTLTPTSTTSTTTPPASTTSSITSSTAVPTSTSTTTSSSSSTTTTVPPSSTTSLKLPTTTTTTG